MGRINVVPLESAGKILFGMKRTEVRDKLEGFRKDFRKTKYSKTLTDDFGFCHVYYDEADECEAVEFFDENEIFVDGKKIFPVSSEDFKTIFRDAEDTGAGFLVRRLSIGLYALDEKPESILIGKNGYYDS